MAAKAKVLVDRALKDRRFKKKTVVTKARSLLEDEALKGKSFEKSCGRRGKALT